MNPPVISADTTSKTIDVSTAVIQEIMESG
jgi:hypothetical protein